MSMMISNWTYRSLCVVLLAAFFAVPLPAFASIKITDVLYNPPGADQGHEWVAISNEGTTSVSLLGYRLFEGGTNHKMTVAQGTSTLAVGEKAIIATNPAQYLADNPSFTGTVFKSAFSLVNSGETISLKDAKLEVVDTYSYTAPVVVPTVTPPKQKAATVHSAAIPTIANKKGATTQPVTMAPEGTAPPALPSVWVYSLGLVTILLVGVGAALYVKPVGMPATKSEAEEFELE